ncbi:MAG: TolC family protein [Bacteroidota bacterium]
MKINHFLLLSFLFGFAPIKAQQVTNFSLKEAIEMALKNSNEINLANTKAEGKKLELQNLKNNYYPDFKVSGQYMRLTSAKINSKLSSGNNPEDEPSSGSPAKINQLVLAQANTTLPLFSGFKLKNSINASENLYKAELAKSAQTKEEIALHVVQQYANLYQTQKSVNLITDNLKSAQQRVLDFKNLEQNGIIPRNDLLKAQLQESKIQLSLDEAIKNVSVINYSLITLLKLPEDYKIGIDETQFGTIMPENSIKNEENAIANRKDLESLRFTQKAGESNIKVAKSAYYPSLAFIGGYTYLDLKNAITVSNAMNFGLGISYDLSSIFKNATAVKAAKNRLNEIKQSEAILSDNIKIQVQQAIENYNLALKQSSVYEQAITQASENFKIVKDKYDNGLSNTTDLFEADAEQLNSKINQTLSRANILLRYYEIQAVSGQLTQSFNLPIAIGAK